MRSIRHAAETTAGTVATARGFVSWAVTAGLDGIIGLACGLALIPLVTRAIIPRFSGWLLPRQQPDMKRPLIARRKPRLFVPDEGHLDGPPLTCVMHRSRAAVYLATSCHGRQEPEDDMPPPRPRAFLPDELALRPGGQDPVVVGVGPSRDRDAP